MDPNIFKAYSDKNNSSPSFNSVQGLFICLDKDVIFLSKPITPWVP